MTRSTAVAESTSKLEPKSELTKSELTPLELPPMELTEAEKAELLEQAVQKREKLAESALEMAKLFIQRGKIEIARRRLKEIATEFDGLDSATEARGMLRNL